MDAHKRTVIKQRTWAAFMMCQSGLVLAISSFKIDTSGKQLIGGVGIHLDINI